MSTILARCAALGIVAGGFAITGDLGRLADRGLKVLNASDVPAARANESGTAEESAPAAASAAAVATLPPAVPPAPLTPTSPTATPPQAISNGPVTKPATAASPATAAAHDPAPVGSTLDFHPGDGGLDQADIATLSPGNRLVIWLTVARRAGTPAYRCLVFDMVDPAAAEALVYEAVSFTADGRPQATATAPRRVKIAGGADGRTVAKGGALRVQRLGIAQGLEGDHGENVGPIVSLDVIR
ncbi:MAG: hypothetical protein ACR2IT_02710 [Pirellulales bacterium]